MKVFVDTDVLLDVVTARRRHYGASARVWTLAEQGRIEAGISALSVANIYYIARRLESRRIATETLKALRASFKVVALDEGVIAHAMDADWKDFEDAVQHASALRFDATCLVTRNTRHFKSAELAVLTPKEFLASLPDEFDD